MFFSPLGASQEQPARDSAFVLCEKRLRVVPTFAPRRHAGDDAQALLLRQEPNCKALPRARLLHPRHCFHSVHVYI